MNMKPEIKQLWIEALESGKYQQGKGQLRNANGEYCCLGVLCELAAKEGVIEEGKTKFNSLDIEGYTTYYDGTWHTISDKVRQWSGFGLDVEENYSLSGDVNHVIGMNDDEGASFADIAEWLRRNA